MTQRSSVLRYRNLPARSAVSLAALALACSDANDISAIQADPAPVDTTLPAQPALPAEPDPAQVDALAEALDISAHLPFSASPPADEERFLSMRDGVRLAASLWFPADVARDVAELPTVYIDEWYSRSDEAVGHPVQRWLDAGFVVAIVDARGYGASFGAQSAFMTSEARADQVEVLRWLTSQPWSNGQVAVNGLSLSGALAGVMTGSGSGDLHAAVIRAADFDQYAHNLFPGGAPNVNMIGGFAGFTQKMRGQACVDDVAACSSSGVLGLAVDTDFSLLQAAFRDHAANADGSALFTSEHRDDVVGSGDWDDMLPREHARVRVPTRVVASWVDGLTADSALLRYASHPNTPTQVVIGAQTHSNGLDGDPFSRTPFRPARPSAVESYTDDVTFVRNVLSGEPIERSIRYLVLGTDTWLTTPVWPPAGVEFDELTLTRAALTAAGAASVEGAVEYRVDPATSGGHHDRWVSQRGLPIHYGDRRRAPGRFLSFDAAPVDADVELAGAAELCLVMSSDQPDGVVIAYLEDVAPDGRVTYLTEGELRLLHRATRGEPCDPAPGTDRSFERADAAPVVPGQRMHVEVSLANVAARIARGHHLRLSLAGADAGTFATLSEVPATWEVSVGGSDGSTLRIPTRPWSAPDEEANATD
jgi:putative CocE/NonD family hydrolase